MEPIFPIATAIKHSLKGYNKSTFKKDLLAGFVVSLIALPLSMALAIAVGLPPEHGIFTAIVAGIVVPLLGGSNLQVTGPTAAFVVVLAPIVSDVGLHGLIWCTLMAGVFLLLFAFLKLGKLINYMPYPVTTGFTAGIAMVLFVLSLNDFLGLRLSNIEGSFMDKAILTFSHIGDIHWGECIVGCITLFCLLFNGKYLKGVTGAILAIVLGTFVAFVLGDSNMGLGFGNVLGMGGDIHTIGNQFSYENKAGETILGIAPFPPIFHFPTFISGSLYTIPTLAEFKLLLFPSFVIAILAALESLLSATVADGLGGTKHNPNAEMNAIGIGNILTALASGIPATGAIARTVTNISNGAKTPLASAFHAVFILLFVLILSPLINLIPMASLAALLIATAIRMSHHKQFFNTLKIAPRQDSIVLLICFGLTVFIDMVAGVVAGILCATFLLMKQVIELTHVEFEGSGDIAPSSTVKPGTLVYHIRGPLFFGTVEKAFDRARIESDGVHKFILNITDVPFIDMTGLVAIKSLLNSIATENCQVHIVSKTKIVTQKIKQKIAKDKFNVFVTFHHSLEEALKG